MFGLLIFLVGGFLCKIMLLCGVAFCLACSCSVVLFSCVELVFELFGIYKAVSICIYQDERTESFVSQSNML